VGITRGLTLDGVPQTGKLEMLEATVLLVMVFPLAGWTVFRKAIIALLVTFDNWK
jgi:hypothetical protein